MVVTSDQMSTTQVIIRRVFLFAMLIIVSALIPVSNSFSMASVLVFAIAIGLGVALGFSLVRQRTRSLIDWILFLYYVAILSLCLITSGLKFMPVPN